MTTSQELAYAVRATVPKFELCSVQSERAAPDRPTADVVFSGASCNEETCDLAMVALGQVEAEYFYGADSDGDCRFEAVSDFEASNFFRAVVQFDRDLLRAAGLSAKEAEGFTTDAITGAASSVSTDHGQIRSRGFFGDTFTVEIHYEEPVSEDLLKVAGRPLKILFSQS